MLLHAGHPLPLGIPPRLPACSLPGSPAQLAPVHPPASRAHHLIARVCLLRRLLQVARPSAILDIIRSAEQFRFKDGSIDQGDGDGGVGGGGSASGAGKSGPGGQAGPRDCERCGYISSQPVCKACVMLEGLNKGLPRLGVSRTRGSNGRRAGLPAEVQQQQQQQQGAAGAEGGPQAQGHRPTAGAEVGRPDAAGIEKQQQKCGSRSSGGAIAIAYDEG